MMMQQTVRTAALGALLIVVSVVVAVEQQQSLEVEMDALDGVYALAEVPPIGSKEANMAANYDPTITSSAQEQWGCCRVCEDVHEFVQKIPPLHEYGLSVREQRKHIAPERGFDDWKSPLVSCCPVCHWPMKNDPTVARPPTVLQDYDTEMSGYARGDGPTDEDAEGGATENDRVKEWATADKPNLVKPTEDMITGARQRRSKVEARQKAMQKVSLAKRHGTPEEQEAAQEELDALSFIEAQLQTDAEAADEYEQMDDRDTDMEERELISAVHLLTTAAAADEEEDAEDTAADAMRFATTAGLSRSERKIVAAAKHAAKSVAKMFKHAGKAVKSVAKKVGGGVKKLLKKGASLLKKAVKKIGKFGNKFGKSLGKIGGKLIGQLKKHATSIAKKAGEALDQAVTEASQLASDATQQVSDSVQQQAESATNTAVDSSSTEQQQASSSTEQSTQSGEQQQTQTAEASSAASSSSSDSPSSDQQTDEQSQSQQQPQQEAEGGEGMNPEQSEQQQQQQSQQPGEAGAEPHHEGKPNRPARQATERMAAFDSPAKPDNPFEARRGDLMAYNLVHNEQYYYDELQAAKRWHARNQKSGGGRYGKKSKKKRFELPSSNSKLPKRYLPPCCNVCGVNNGPRSTPERHSTCCYYCVRKKYEVRPARMRLRHTSRPDPKPKVTLKSLEKERKKKLSYPQDDNEDIFSPKLPDFHANRNRFG